MNDRCSVRPAQAGDQAAWATLRTALWPQVTAAENAVDVARILDALLDNTGSHAAHLAYGFAEAERVVCFVKRV